MSFLMSKKTIALLLGMGNGLVIVGVSMVWIWAIYPGALVGFAGVIVGVVAWIATLVKQAKGHQWGWFTGTLAAWFIGLWLSCSIYTLMYLILVPETPHYAFLVPEPDVPEYQLMQQDTHPF